MRQEGNQISDRAKKEGLEPMRIAAIVDRLPIRAIFFFNLPIVAIEVTQEKSHRCSDVSAIEEPGNLMLSEHAGDASLNEHRGNSGDGAPGCGGGDAAIEAQREKEKP